MVQISIPDNTKLDQYNDAFLNEMRTLGDPAADVVIANMFKHDGGAGMRDVMRRLASNSDLSQTNLPHSLGTFYRSHAVLPDWADQRLMRRGATFFSCYGGAIMSMLGALSLPYCYAGANGAQVLFLSKRIYEDAPRRLLETSQFVLDVMDPDAFETGKGFTSALNVRLMHAAIRYHILASDSWDYSWGHPINQEDMAGTIAAFSFICIRGLRKVGYRLNNSDVDAFLHLWNVIGYIMGVRYELLPDTSLEACRLDQWIRERQFRPSEAGKALTKALIDTMSKEPLEGLPSDFVASYTRFLLGEEIADILDVPRIGASGRLLGFLKWRNYFSSLLAQNEDKNLREVRRQIKNGQAGNLVRFAVPLSI